MRKLLEELKQLVDTLAATMKQDTAEGKPSLRIQDLSEKFKNVLTPEAAIALAPNRKTTLYAFDAENGPSTYSRAIFLSAIVHSPAGIERAAMALYEDINTLAAKGVLRGHLAPLSLLTLSDGVHSYQDLHEYILPEGSPKTYAVYVFPHVALEWKPEGLEFEADEGSVGVDLEPELKVGEPVHSPTCKFCVLLGGQTASIANTISALNDELKKRQQDIK